MLLFYMVRKENQNMKIKRLLAAVLSLAMGVSMMTAVAVRTTPQRLRKIPQLQKILRSIPMTL